MIITSILFGSRIPRGLNVPCSRFTPVKRGMNISLKNFFPFLCLIPNSSSSVASSNLSDKSFYAQINGVTVMEFDSLKDANKVVDALNVAVQSVMDTFKSDYDSKIGAILA